MASLARLFRKQAAKSQRILFLDCCFAGEAASLFQAELDQVVSAKANEVVEEDPADRGIALLCASSARNPAKVESLTSYTYFGHELIQVLTKGDPNISGPLTLHQLCQLVRRGLRSAAGDDAPNPEVHVPDQERGDLAAVPLFPNPARRLPDSVATREPRDVAIVLEPSPSGGFTCTVKASTTWHTVLPITATELAFAVDSVRQSMMSVLQKEHDGEHVFQTGIDIPDPIRDWALSTLARAGALLFQRLFLHPAAKADARAVGEWLRDQATAPGSRLKVQVVADQAPLPWALLYTGDASKGAQLSWNNFLGMRHIIEQLPLRSSLSTQGNKIPSRPKLAVSLNVNTSIDPSMGITLVADHQQHWQDTAAARRGLALVSRSTTTEVVRALADPATGDQLMYFFCHAQAKANADPHLAEIIMGPDNSVSLADLSLDAPTTIQMAGNPLVFINGSASPLFHNVFVPYFMAKGGVASSAPSSLFRSCSRSSGRTRSSTGFSTAPRSARPC